MKRFFLLFFLFTMFMPQTSYAVTDTRCWIKDECIDQRKTGLVSLTDAEAREGFVTSTESRAVCGEKDAAGKELGFCLPATKAKTETSFGGQNVFSDIGEFIGVLYKYGIIAAGVLATLMLIAAGFIWTTSGGNSERIGSAKKRIGGALMGLLLAVLSYSLLNVINPNLVNIRLPQVWMINTQGIAPPWCDQITPEKKVQKIEGSITMSQAEIDAASKNIPSAYTATSTDAGCGYSYHVEGADDLLCTGRVCEYDPKGNICYQYIAVDHEKVTKWHCVNTNLILSMRMKSTWTTLLANIDLFKAFLETIENKWIDIGGDDPEIWRVCEGQDGIEYRADEESISWNRFGQLDQSDKLVSTKGVATVLNQEVYDYDLVFPPIDLTASKWCTHSPNDKLKGIFVMIELKEAGDLTDPDLWIGQVSPKENNPPEAKLGAWLKAGEQGTSITYDDYIPIENLQKGVYMEVNVTTDVFQTIETYTGSSNGMPINRTADPGTNVSKKYTDGKVQDGTKELKVN